MCASCGESFRSETSANSARAMLSRHRRERHGAAAARVAAVRTRRDSTAAAMRGGRAAASAPGTALAVDLKVFVLCPIRRERAAHLYSRTRAAFLCIGVQRRAILRLDGCDLLRERMPRRCIRRFSAIALRGGSARASEIVTVSLLHAFSARAANFLRGGDSQRFVFLLKTTAGSTRT